MWILLGIEHTKYDIHWAFLVLQKQSKGGAVCSQRLRARGVAPLPGVRRPWKHADTQEGCHGEVTLLPQPRGQSCSIGLWLHRPKRHSGSRGPAPALKEILAGNCQLLQGGTHDRCGPAATARALWRNREHCNTRALTWVCNPSRMQVRFCVIFIHLSENCTPFGTPSLQKHGLGKAASVILHSNSVASRCLQHAKGRQECSRPGGPVRGCQPPWATQSLIKDLPRASGDRGVCNTDVH